MANNLGKRAPVAQLVAVARVGGFRGAIAVCIETFLLAFFFIFYHSRIEEGGSVRVTTELSDLMSRTRLLR